MSFSPKEILKFVEENDVKFIRLTFCDMFGNLKNVAIMPNELPRAFEYGIPFDASCIAEGCSDLLLVPDISTLSVLPWRPKSGRVVRFFCSLKNTDGSDYVGDMRTELTNYINQLRLDGYSCEMGTKCEFYLFELDERGEPTKIPHDKGGYLDVAPLDKCENARREICLSLEEMGMSPKSSCHKHGPAQNEIEFRESEPITAADNMVHYKTVVKSIAAQNGLFASFMPKPLPDEHGSALSISISLKKGGDNIFGNDINAMPHEGKCFISGVLSKIREITAFLNCTTNSYKRFGIGYAPKYVNWSTDNRSQLIRVPKPVGISPRIEIRSADACCNPYITFKLILAAGIEGILGNDSSLFESAMHSDTAGSVFQPLPSTLEEATSAAKASHFVRSTISPELLGNIFAQLDRQIFDYEQAADKDKFEEESYFKFV
ncbi:MAG: glutamine synthetase [Ruminococcus sp.]|uniref:glutamine synthetase family protein n=1 Tax=Ruminococcus sp. TaxID=41978 RepID=UPI001B1CA6DA|nr:glutamine synthetase family protein [Ruminococcus sp.]MBO7472752.1 glutamine synthetase [Ruminococcus sp.]